MKKTGSIKVIPLGGLANRLRVVATAIKLARQSNKKLYIYWQPNKYLNAEFREIFDVPKNMIIRKPPLAYQIWLKFSSLSPKFKKMAIRYLAFFKFDFIFTDSMAVQVLHNKIDLEQKVFEARHVFICSCQELNYFDLEDYHLFVPRKELLEKIKGISNSFSSDTLGIHIRSTDNIWSKENSPFLLFINQMENEINDNPETNFFLATDNEEYQKKLIEIFGCERIIFNDKMFRRDLREGIEDAVIDLYCLSKTSKIFGSYFSSFSYVAGRIGNVQVQIVKQIK